MTRLLTRNSRYAPPDVDGDTSLGVSSQSAHGMFLRSIDFIIWDDASLQHWRCSEYVGRLMCDLRNNGKLFVGVPVVCLLFRMAIVQCN